MMPVNKLKNMSIVTPMQNIISDWREMASVGSDTIRCTQFWWNEMWHVHMMNVPKIIFQNVWRVVRSNVMLFAVIIGIIQI